MKHFLIIFVSCYVRFASLSFCYWNTPCSYRYFASVTSYSAVRGDIRDSAIKIEECEPISMWGMFRHGKTNPGIKTALGMKEAIAIQNLIVSSYEKGRCSLCAQDIDNLRDWPVNKDMFEQPRNLQDEGHQDMLGIGYRLKKAFPSLFDTMEDKSYAFRAIRSQWVEDSYKAFMKGLNGEDILGDDSVSGLDFIDTVDDHNIPDHDHQKFVTEADKYITYSDYLAAKDRIQRRLGIDYSLTDNNITGLYDLCRYTWSSLKNKASPWCALFTTEDLKVLEYKEDLSHYYTYGYGNLDTSLAQIPLANLLESFKYAKIEEEKKVTAYFTNAGTLESIYTALGLFKDKIPLTAALKSRDRLWRTSKMSASSANLFMVLNRCANKNSSDYHIMFYFNEEPLRFLCEGGICCWGQFEKILSTFLNKTQKFNVK